jgi:hypothetical protein
LDCARPSPSASARGLNNFEVNNFKKIEFLTAVENKININLEKIILKLTYTTLGNIKQNLISSLILQTQIE